MSDTPRTDAICEAHISAHKDWFLSGCNALSSHGRLLERELAVAQAKIAELEAQRTATDKWMRYTENLLEKYRSIVVVVSSGMQPEDYGRPEVTIVRFQNMIDEVLKNG